MKSKKTTYEERIEILEYISNHNLSYKDAAETFNVSYNNVYSWFQRYIKFGPKALEDDRGKQKASDVQTDAEQSKAEIGALKARNR